MDIMPGYKGYEDGAMDLDQLLTTCLFVPGFFRTIRDSSMATVFPGPPSCTGFRSSSLLHMSCRKLLQSTAVLGWISRSWIILSCCNSRHHQSKKRMSFLRDKCNTSKKLLLPGSYAPGNITHNRSWFVPSGPLP